MRTKGEHRLDADSVIGGTPYDDGGGGSSSVGEMDIICTVQIKQMKIEWIAWI